MRRLVSCLIALSTAAAVVSVATPAGADTLSDAAAPRFNVEDDLNTDDSLPLVDTYVHQGLMRNSGPSRGDLDGDGRDELVIGAEDGILRAFRSGDLDQLMFEVAAVPAVHPNCRPQSTPTSIDAGPVIVDIDGDGANEILVGMGSTYVPNQNGGLNAYEADGSLKWRFSPWIDKFNVWDPSVGATPDGWCEGVISDAAVGDVNGDGHLDVVFGGWDHRVHALDGRTGAQLSGFPFDNVDTIWSSPALLDVDGDGRDEIFIGGDDTPGIPGHYAGGQFHALDWSAGQVSHLWKKNPLEVVGGGVAIGDANGDGRHEVYVTTGTFYRTAESYRVLAWHADDGSVVPGFPVAAEGFVTGDLALGDLDGDGALEIVAGAWDHTVSAWRADGSLMWRTTLCCNWVSEGLNRVIADAVIADGDGDGDQDVIIASTWSTNILDGRTGERIHEVAIGLSSDSSTAVIEHPDGTRLLVTSSYSLPQNRHELRTYALPASSAAAHWPQVRGVGGGRSAVADCPTGDEASDPARSTGTGYWMLDRSGVVYPFGEAVNLGDLASRGLVGRIAVDLEPTRDGQGYYLLDSVGCVYAFGSAQHQGNVNGDVLDPGERPTTLSATDGGYLVFTDRGRAMSFGSAGLHGDVSDVALNGPVLGSSIAPDQRGYYMVASDGGIFSFGSARFLGSMGDTALNEPVVDLVPDPDGTGYWLIAADGGIFSFDAEFRGSVPQELAPNQRLNAPIIGAVAYGNGYVMVASDGGAFVYSDRAFEGSLGDNPPQAPIVAIATNS